MGRLKSISPSHKMLHFSHPHELELCTNIQNEISNSILCSACKLPPNSDSSIYKCNFMGCNFFLHLGCAQLPQLMIHPSHANHTLTLLPISTYPGGVFNCDACNSRGNGFSYHCSSCEYDLHVTCAAKPSKVTHQFHSCPLELTFLKNPYQNIKGFSCDICRKIGSKQWLYRCSACEFDVHLDCITATPLPAPALGPAFIQSQFAHQMLMQERSLNPINAGRVEGSIRPNQYVSHHHHHHHQPELQSSSMAGGQGIGVVRPNYLMQNNNNNNNIQLQPSRRIDDQLLNAVIQGAVEGGSQQGGQSFMQSVIGGGSSSSGGGEDESSIPGSISGGPSHSTNY